MEPIENSSKTAFYSFKEEKKDREISTPATVFQHTLSASGSDGPCRSTKPAAALTDSLARYPATAKKTTKNFLHGLCILDDYQWLENGKTAEVEEWDKLQGKLTRGYLDKHTKIKPLVDQFLPLLIREEYSPPREVLEGKRRFSYMQKPHQDQSVCFIHDGENKSELVNPNYWSGGKTADFWNPSRDGKYMAIGVAHRGDENTLVHIMNVDTKEFLPDTCKGWKQKDVSWAPGHTGFYYTANPDKGEVPAGEENYWYAVYYHRLGTSKESDIKVFSSDVKEDYHFASFAEDGRHAIFCRSKVAQNELYIKPTGYDGELVPLARGFDAKYEAQIIDGRIVIKTDSCAPILEDMGGLTFR